MRPRERVRSDHLGANKYGGMLGHVYVLASHVPSTALHCSCRIPLRYDVRGRSSPHGRCTFGGKPPLRHPVRRRTTRRQCRVGPNEHVQNDRSVWRSVQVLPCVVNIDLNIRVDSYTAGATNGPTWVQNLADSTGAKLVNYAVSGT
jgi:hypothetical protein